MKKESGNHAIGANLAKPKLAPNVEIALEAHDPAVGDRGRGQAGNKLTAGDRVNEAAIGGERRQRRDERLKPQEHDQDAVEGARQRAKGDRRGQDQIARHMQDLRHVEHDHAHHANNGANGEIDSADENGKRLPHGKDGYEREPRHEVLGIRGGSEAGGEQAKEGYNRREEKNERGRRGAEGHGMSAGRKAAAAYDAAARSAAGGSYQRCVC